MEDIRTISSLNRMPSSKNGNPRFMVTFTDGTSAPTEVDGQIGYGIENPEYRNVPLRVTLSKHGHIKHLTPVKER